jgi:uncharacterized cupredoxin-like copper-binding protein
MMSTPSFPALLRRPTVWAIAVALALTLAACGSDNSGNDTSASGGHGAGHATAESLVDPVAGAGEVTLTAVDVDFQPARLELTAGEPVNVTLVNEGEAEHDFTLEEAGVHAVLQPGARKTTSITIDEPGSYQADCTVPGHAEAGMNITVEVT